MKPKLRKNLLVILLAKGDKIIGSYVQYNHKTERMDLWKKVSAKLQGMLLQQCRIMFVVKHFHYRHSIKRPFETILCTLRVIFLMKMHAVLNPGRA